MNNKLKIVLAATGFGIVALIGISRSSFAQSATQSPVAVLRQLKQVVKPDIGDNDAEKNDDVQDQQELAKLQKLIKITPQQAQQAAEAIQLGKVSSVKLENENGNVVYSVVIGKAEVVVDAGNARILSNTSDRENGKEASEQKQPKSSIQTSVDPSDGDGEKKDG